MPSKSKKTNSSKRKARVKSPPAAVTLRIELQHVSPLIWRRVIVPDDWTLAELHAYLQWVIGWQDCHAHEFEVGERIVAPDWWLKEIDGDHTKRCADETEVIVREVVAELGTAGVFDYRYDMGDGWEHRILIEASPALWQQYELTMPVCTAGENACPPEDVGGPSGYEHLLEALADRRHDDHVRMLDWICGAFDPKGFDLNRVNRAWLEFDRF